MIGSHVESAGFMCKPPASDLYTSEIRLNKGGFAQGAGEHQNNF